MEKHTSQVTPDFTTGSAFIKGESTLAVLSIGTFDELAAKLERAIDGIGLEIVLDARVDVVRDAGASNSQGSGSASRRSIASP